MHDTNQVLRGVAHDINGLMARASIAAEQLQQHGDVTVKNSADKIVEAIDRVAEICRSQLANSRKRNPPTFHDSAGIEKLIRQVTDLAALETISKDRELTFRRSVQSGVGVACDDAALFRVLFNLTINAAGAIARSRGSWIEIEVTAAYGRVFFVVSDNGPGLPEHVLAYLLPRVNGAPAHKGPLGSGLITAASLAREMGGQLNLVLSGSIGTVFCLALPEASRAKAQTSFAALDAELAPAKTLSSLIAGEAADATPCGAPSVDRVD